MIKKMPLTFLDVERKSTYDLFYVCTSEAPKEWEGKISIFKKHFTVKITLILMIKKCP